CQKLFALCAQMPAEATATQHLARWWRALAELGLAKALQRPEPRGSEGTPLGRAVLRALARDQAASEAARALYRDVSLAVEQDRRQVNGELKRDAFRLSTGEADGRASWRVAEDRLLFFLALAATREKATLSFARLSGGTREQIASPFLTELERLSGARVEQREL